MARDFIGASNQYLNGGNITIVDNAALAVSAWVNFTGSLAPSETIISKGFDGAETAFELKLADSSANDISFGSFSGSAHAASGAHGLSVGTWAHIYGDYDTTDWHVYVNGSLIDTTTDAVGPQSNARLLHIGAVDVSGSPTNFITAIVAEVAIWTAALSAGEIAGLAKAFSPLHFRPASLLLYAPLIGRSSPELDLVGGTALTLVNTPTVAAHPRIIMPRRRRPPRFVVPPPPTETLFAQACL